MEKTFAKAEELAAHVKEYVNNRVAAAKLSIAEKTSKLAAKIIAIIIVALVFFLFLIFASTALAYALSKLTGELYWGFLIVGAIYFVLVVIIWKSKERFIRLPIMNAILGQLFNDADEED